MNKFNWNCSPGYQDNYPPDNYPPDNYPRTNTPRTITPLGQIPPDIYPPLRNFSSTYLRILCTYILHILFFLEEPNIHFMFHIINPFVYIMQYLRGLAHNISIWRTLLLMFSALCHPKTAFLKATKWPKFAITMHYLCTYLYFVKFVLVYIVTLSP